MKKSILIFCLILQTLALRAQSAPETKGVWGKIDHKGAPWVENISKPNNIKYGLAGRHVSLWASHGRYYDQDKGRWKWQRPYLFGTTEDLFTQTIVVPYLIPMLENAGCYVFTPRERSWQRNEIIIDSEGITPGGKIIKMLRNKAEETVGFGVHGGVYEDTENPFTAGKAIRMKSTSKAKHASTVTYVPEIKEEGEYAVYVSYPKVDRPVDDALYIVRHKGVSTNVRVNQTMGYGTWVYIGTWEFGKGESEDNCVVMTNVSNHNGMVGTDAVRFGGGMGNIMRGGRTSGMPRCLEGARYYCQWAGAPYDVYSTRQGTNDYADDINTRSLMTNWVGGGSCFMPTKQGLGVPIELSLAVHSDAGFNPDGQSIHGSLGIATTDFNDGQLDAGVTRQTSLDLASRLLNNMTRDMSMAFGEWNQRYLWDRNYSETRLPAVPSAIIETLSHQSFPDMRVAQHPMGKFHIARSIYKTIARYINDQHGKPTVIQPLAPENFCIERVTGNKVTLSWTGVIDGTEPTSMPESYNIYTAIGDQGFDNGQNVKVSSVRMTLVPDVLYQFKITACNDGGESFPTQTLAAYISSQEKACVMVVDGFERLSSPHVINNEALQGFSFIDDEGVQRGFYPGWSGYQQVFTKSTMGSESETGLGYSGQEFEGVFFAGNTMDVAVQHARMIASSGRYTVVSSSLSAVEKGLVALGKNRAIDIAFGLQKDDGQLGFHYKTFTKDTQRQISEFARSGGAILASGANIGSDMAGSDDRNFTNNIMKYDYASSKSNINPMINGLGMQYEIFASPNEVHYAASHPDIISPTDGAICTMQYADGTSAAVGFKGGHSTFVVGFPLECIKSAETKNKIMQGILAYLIN